MNDGRPTSTTLNIAILPSEEASTQAIAMSRKIADELGSRFVLGLKTLAPHITVYQGEYPDKNIDRLKNIVSKLASEQEVFEIKLDSIKVSHGTFVFWNCEKTNILKKIHRRAVELANPLREGLIPSQLADRTGLTPGDRYDIKTFGALLIGPRYDPHITIARLNKEEDAKKVISILGRAKKPSFKPKGLILGYLGEDGTVTGIAEYYNFRRV